MKFVFLHPTHFSYDPRTPLVQPLGGTESAVAYLSAALVRAGARVTILNNCPVARQVDGVEIAHTNPISASSLEDCDLFVVVSSAIGKDVRPFLSPKVPAVLWCHHDIDQRGVFRLSEQEERDSWTGYVMVSKWQAERFAKHYSLPVNDMHVIRNAVSPAFLEQAAGPAWFETGDDPSLVYSSTPFRGLDVLLQSFPTIREMFPRIRLKIHSSMNIYGMGPERDAYQYLYSLARSLPGVDYLGPLPQQQLARSLQGMAAMAYPSTFRETSCIAVMEGLASGADIITTGLGALPETLRGFGHMLPVKDNQRDFATGPAFINGYINLVAGALREVMNNPTLAAEKRRARVDFARQNYTWDVRAREWIELVHRLKSGK